ncbi:AAA family ATPase, partial [Peribacillus butanolivorans]|uniref:AAA family ATPase n=1 Tax=Peribacillus butanolivorans TaxID=421767 RepID=UPI00365DD495
MKNYKSIVESGYLEINDKINIFAGKNNTGKTALIEAIYKSVNGVIDDSLGTELKTVLELEISIQQEDLDILNNGMQNEYLLYNIN